MWTLLSSSLSLVATFTSFLAAVAMSFTVDDLVSSLSTNHIGQEAIDLAALQVSYLATGNLISVHFWFH